MGEKKTVWNDMTNRLSFYNSGALHNNTDQNTALLMQDQENRKINLLNKTKNL